MAVGINGSIGKPMIREGQGLDIYVRRSLRDVFRKVPTFSLEVKVIPSRIQLSRHLLLFQSCDIYIPSKGTIAIYS